MNEGDEQAGFRWRRPLPPKPPVVRDWHWGLGVVGRIFITLGLLILAFVGYQLWGTGIEFRANQRDLRNELRSAQEAIVGTAPASTLPPATTTPGPVTTPVPGATTVPTTPSPSTAPVPAVPPLEMGDVVGALDMPTITGTTYYLVAGVRVEDLKRGVGHYPSTPLPGQYGNAALAGHRTTYGAPFEHLDKLEPGDPISVTTLTGQRYVYVVDTTEIIDPSETRVLSQPDDPSTATLTLTTCHPKRSTKKRLIVHAHFDRSQSTADLAPRTAYYAPLEAATTTTPTTVPPTTGPVRTLPGTPTTAAPPTTVAPTTVAPTTIPEVLPGDESGVDPSDADDLARGWFHDAGAWPHIVGWGFLLVAISLGSWYFGRWMGRRWVGWVAAAAPFVVVLYFFFQNVNRLLPPGL